MADPAETIVTIVAFLRAIGIAVSSGTVDDGFLPGIATIDGGIVYDPDRLTWPGDLLHDAGHLAVSDPAIRASLQAIGDDPAEEMAATAWSYAAARHLGIDPRIVFHSGGYHGGGDWLADAYDGGATMGQPMLAWWGMTRHGLSGPAAAAPYPAMARWLR